jgi:hypothetical protein
MDNFYINFVEKVSQKGFFKSVFYKLRCKWFGHKWISVLPLLTYATEDEEKNTLFICKCGEQIDFDQHKSLIRDEKLSKILK